VFGAVTEEVVRVLPVDLAIMGRYESDAVVTCVAASSTTEAGLPVGVALTLDGTNVSTVVAHTGRAARIDRYTDPSGSIAVPFPTVVFARWSGRRSLSRAACGG
jgi:hypothetical protein